MLWKEISDLQHYAYSALLICITSNIRGGGEGIEERDTQRTGNEDEASDEREKGGFPVGVF